MDWETLTGREGEELDGFFPEPDDLEKPGFNNSIPYDKEEINYEMDWFCQTYMDVVLEHLGIPNDDEHRDEIDDALVEGLGLISTELSDIVSGVQIEELADKLEKFGFIDGYHKSLFIHKMNKCLSNPSANEYDCLESVIDDCYKT